MVGSQSIMAGIDTGATKTVLPAYFAAMYPTHNIQIRTADERDPYGTNHPTPHHDTAHVGEYIHDITPVLFHHKALIGLDMLQHP